MSAPQVINLFGGPGAGKSTAAARVFAALKDAAVNVELVTEFAKDLTWEHRTVALACQEYVLGEQVFRVQRALSGGASLVITDSPPLLTAVYGQSKTLALAALDAHLRFPSLNYVLARVKPYNPVGRNQTEAEAHKLDLSIRSTLDFYNVPYTVTGGNAGGAEVIIKATLAALA